MAPASVLAEQLHFVRGSGEVGVFQLVDRALEQFFRDAVPLPENAVEVSFNAPDRTWGAAVSRPTVNIFLWEVARNPGFAHTGLLERAGAAGRVERRPSSPVVDLHYLVTAWTSEPSDEHQLLGSILRCVLANAFLPAQYLPEQLAGNGRVPVALATHEKRRPGEFWSAIDGRLKPGIEVEVTLPLDVFSWQPAGPPAESVTADVRRLPSAPTPTSDAEQEGPLRRRRAGGALVMEGRPADVESEDLKR
jgi:hypothetical protein